MKIKNIVPKDKADVEFINGLCKYGIDEVREVVPTLLASLQDGNWPCAGPVADYLAKHTNEIYKEILNVLRGNDETWKYWVVKFLVLHSEVIPNSKIMQVVERIAYSPTKPEKIEEVDEIALEVIDKYKPVD
ncbi:DUF5071 domain-containing protein [Flagellimonas sp. DF-77]|uniref:DUF5071 domain-containing protein n=1 Tax=Flagellimonas algarum TaxID=3230298 RepID=UPI00339768D2